MQEEDKEEEKQKKIKKNIWVVYSCTLIFFLITGLFVFYISPKPSDKTSSMNKGVWTYCHKNVKGYTGCGRVTYLSLNSNGEVSQMETISSNGKVRAFFYKENDQNFYISSNGEKGTWELRKVEENFYEGWERYKGVILRTTLSKK